METKANHVLVGAFALLVAIAGLVLIGWLGRAGVNQEYVDYQIIFHGSVTGLSEGSDVRYNGIKVGSVDSLELSRANPSNVEVGIQVYPTTPIRTDSVASIGYQGLTGVAYVQISGGSANAPLLRRASDRKFPVIPSKPSGIEQLVAGAPDLLASATELMNKLNGFVGPQNQQAFSKVMDNLAVISGTLAQHRPEADQIIANSAVISRQLVDTTAQLETLATRLNQLTERAQKTLATTNGLLQGDGAAFLREARLAAASYRETGEALQRAISQNQSAIDTFSGQGLTELTRLASDTRQLVATLDRLAQRMENEPARFLLGQPVPEYEPK